MLSLAEKSFLRQISMHESADSHGVWDSLWCPFPAQKISIRGFKPRDVSQCTAVAVHMQWINFSCQICRFFFWLPILCWLPMLFLILQGWWWWWWSSSSLSWW